MHFPQVAHQPPMAIEQPAPPAAVAPYLPHGPAAHWLSIVNPALTAGAHVNPGEINEALAMALAQNDGPAMRELVSNYGAPPLQLPPWFEHNMSPDDVRRQLEELATLGNDTASPEMAGIARHLLANPFYAQASLLRGTDGRTPLMAAASNPRSVEMLQAFLEVPGANPNLRTPAAENSLSLTLLAHSAIVPNSLTTMRAKMELLIDSGVKINTTAYAPGEMPVDDELAQHVVGNDIHPISLAVMKNMPNAVVLRLTQACLNADIPPGLYSLFERAEFVAPGTIAPTEIRCAMEDLVRALTPPQFRWLMEHPAALQGEDFPLDMSCILNACEAHNFDRAALLLARALNEDVPLEIIVSELHTHEQFFDDAIEVAQAAVDLALAYPARWAEPMARVLTTLMTACGVTLDPQAGTVTQFTYAPAGYMVEALVASQQAEIQQVAGGPPGQLLVQTLRGMAVNQLVSAAAARIPQYLNELGMGQAGQPGTPEVQIESVSPQPW
ncbi:MAG: ankyrin repeat domain-containing protein [Burkholderiaceae bacterium]|nr:ankyrin repeat domain-containing protein [Burkholderiaceae bacterium]